MRITSVEVFWLRLDLPAAVADAMTDVRHWDVVATRIGTDAGIAGWGYNCTLAEGSRALVALIEDDLAPKLIGQDPHDVERLWRETYLTRHFTGITGVAVQGVAAPEIALRDILAKAAGQPLWRLLGGDGGTARVPVYSTDGGWLGFGEAELVANAKAVRDAGFHGFKMKVGLPDLDEDVRRLAAVRAAVGPDYPVMIDANGRWSLEEARQATALFAPYRPYWLEEPLHPFDVPAHAELARATKIPILAGETLYDIRMFRDFMAAGALGLAQPDVLKLGGIGCWMEVAALARTFGLQVVPAGFNLMQIDAHLMAAIPHGLMMEYLPWLGPIFERPVQVENGFALVPREPGVGADIRPEAIERYGIA
jgi:L-alanine-DL-glutamate epimerase-like enolase superfamily enzyme